MNPYNISNCTLTTDYVLDKNSYPTKCTLKIVATYCRQVNSTNLIELKIINYEQVTRQNEIKSRQRRANEYSKENERSEDDLIDDYVNFDGINTIVGPHILTYHVARPDPRFVLNELKSLLENDNITIESGVLNNVLNQVDTILNEEIEEDIPAELLQALDQLSFRIGLQSSNQGSVVRDNIAIMAVDSTPQMRLRGMRIGASAGSAFTRDSIDLVTGENEESLQMTTDQNEAVFLLPESATAVERRISLMAFRSGRSFVDSSCQLNSKVLSINVENYTLGDGEIVEIYFKPWTWVHYRNQTRTCAYWHFNENGTGHWSQEGCTFTKAKDGLLDLCQCNHLTHFAEVIIYRNVFPQSDENALQIISIIGCCLSLFGLTVIALTAALFKSWRNNNSNKIWLNLGSAVFILDVCFLVTVFVVFEDNVGCVIVGAALHYSVLATFCWMLVVSVLSYRKLVLVFTSELPCKLLVTQIFAWGFPFLVIAILFAENPKAYSRRFEERSPSGQFCYPKGLAFILSVFLPMAVMWLVNWVLYAIILRSIFTAKKTIRRHSSSQDTLKTASISCLLAFLCGIPWIFGFFAYNIVAAYLFSMTVTFQGFVLFLFFILGNKKTRILWMNLFRNRSRRVVFITSSDRSNNRGIITARYNIPSHLSTRPDNAAGPLLEESRL